MSPAYWEMQHNRTMGDAFLCRYGNQQWTTLQTMDDREKQILAWAIRELIDGEGPPDASGGPSGL